MEGYTEKDKPDVSWWVTQVQAGMQWRDTNSRKEWWDRYQAFYRNRFKPGIFTKNIYFTMRRSVVPRIYMRNPSISVTHAKPGPRQAALAKTMERVHNSLMKSMGMKVQMRRMVDTSFYTGTGVGKLGFGSEYMPTPEPGGTKVPVVDGDKRVEFRSGITENMPWFMSVHTGDFVLPEFCVSNETAWFQAHWVNRFKDDVLRDPRMKNVDWDKKTKPLSDLDPVVYGSAGVIHRDVVRMLEIRDRRRKKAIILAPYDTEDFLFYEDDELQTDYSSPWYLFTPNPDDQIAWGVSDATILRQYQEQLNEIKTKMHWHMRQSVVKLLYEKGAIKEPELAKMTSEEVQAAVEVSNINKIEIMQAGMIPDALFKMEQEVMNDVREVMGFSRNQFGEYQAVSHGPTATETRAVQEALNLRVDERRDQLSDLMVNVFQDIQQIIFRHWKKDQVVKVVGPDGYATWVEFTGEMLQEGQYEVTINPDSAITETKEVREARAEKYYANLSQNPLVDNVKLTKYYLGELPGVTFDDILLEQEPANPLPQSIDQFSQQFNGQSPAAGETIQ